MDAIYVWEYIQYLHINQTIASEYVIRISHFTKQLVYVSSFTNMFYNNHIWEQIYCFLQFPGGSCKPRAGSSHWSLVFPESIDSAFWGSVFNHFSDAWLAAELQWCSCGRSERYLSLYSPLEDGNRPYPIPKNENQSNCCDVLQICLYSFSCVVILNIKTLILNNSFCCIPSDQRVCERRGTLCLYRSVQWPMTMLLRGFSMQRRGCFVLWFHWSWSGLQGAPRNFCA